RRELRVRVEGDARRPEAAGPLRHVRQRPHHARPRHRVRPGAGPAPPDRRGRAGVGAMTTTDLTIEAPTAAPPSGVAASGGAPAGVVTAEAPARIPTW